MLLTLYHIARNTFRECIRQPIYAILLMTALAIIGNHPVIAAYVFREQVKLVTDGTLATVLLFGWITAVLCASYAVSREIDTGTVLLILAKPVNRAVFIVAKIVGILAALALFVWITGIGVLMALRMAVDQFRFDIYIYAAFFVCILLACLWGGIRNYVSKSSFPAQTCLAMGILFSLMLVVVYFVPEYSYGSYTDDYPRYPANVIGAIILILFAVLAMGTLATALSTQFNLVTNLSVCFVFFILGLMSDYFYEQLRALDLETLLRISHLWFVPVVGVLAGLWLLAAKHFPVRRNQRVRRWELHLAFVLAIGGLIVRGMHDVNHKVYLDANSGLLRAVAQVVYAAKNQLAEVLHAVIPNWQLLWMADALAAGKQIGAAYLVLGLLYVMFFIITFAVLAFALFINREVGKQVLR